MSGSVIMNLGPDKIIQAKGGENGKQNYFSY